MERKMEPDVADRPSGDSADDEPWPVREDTRAQVEQAELTGRFIQPEDPLYT